MVPTMPSIDLPQAPSESTSTQFEGLHNFRDIGGLPTRTGRRTRSGEIYRADCLSRCTPSDLDRLGDLGITRVIDLRTPEERVSGGAFDHRCTDIEYHHCPVIDRTWFPRLPRLDRTWEEYLLLRYMEMIEDHGERIAFTMRVIATSPGPAVVHCTLGKDRTGVVMALMLAGMAR